MAVYQQTYDDESPVRTLEESSDIEGWQRIVFYSEVKG